MKCRSCPHFDVIMEVCKKDVTDMETSKDDISCLLKNIYWASVWDEDPDEEEWWKGKYT